MSFNPFQWGSRRPLALALVLVLTLQWAAPSLLRAQADPSSTSNEPVSAGSSDGGGSGASDPSGSTVLGQSADDVGKLEESPSSSSGDDIPAADPTFVEQLSGKADPVTFARDVGISVAKDAIKGTVEGQPVEVTLQKAKEKVSRPELYAALVGGRIGSLLAGLIPIPGVGGLLGQMAARLPLTVGAMMGGRATAGLVGQKASGKKLSFMDVLRSIDWTEFAAAAVGSTIGAVLCSAVFPPPWGAIVGSWLGSEVALAGVKIFRKLRKEKPWVKLADAGKALLNPWKRPRLLPLGLRR